MLEKFITQLKNSLPEALRKKMGVVEESVAKGQALENNAAVKKIVPVIAASAASSDDEKKQRISMIIRVIVILGIAYFALDEFVLKADKTPSVDEVVAQQQAMKKKKKVKEAAAKTAATTEATKTANPEAATSETANTEAQSGTTIPAEKPASTEMPVADTSAPVENINILNKETAATDAPAATKATTTSAPSTTPTETSITPAPEKASEVVTSSRVIGQANVDQKIDQLMDGVDQSGTVEEVKIPSQPAIDAATMTTTSISSSMDSMASKITEDVPETAPPAYDQVGRGLVYNCKDKYWACLDKASYVTCNKNMKWNKSKGKAQECVVQNIYNSDEDCAKVQKYNVSSDLPTAFCAN
jgi:hypothetical protein